MASNDNPRTVRAYLTALKTALKGEPRALIQDALTDAEEHLRAAIQQSPGKKEADIMAEAVASYGSPAEVADAYRDADRKRQGPFADDGARPSGGGTGFFGAIADPRAYGALLYMLLSMATGIFYFVWVVTGFSLSLGLFVLIIGIPFALLFVASVRVLAHIEGRIVESLLGVRMPRRIPSAPDGSLTFGARIKAMLTDLRTWTAMFYMVIQLALGIAYFVISVVGLALSGILIGAPVIQYGLKKDVLFINEPQLDAFFNTPLGLALMVPVGLLLILVLLNLARGIGFMHGRYAEHMLVRL